MSVNSTGAIGYEAKTDPKGRVTVTYQGKTTTYKNYKEFVELFKNKYDAQHPPVKDLKGTTVQANPNDKELTADQRAKKDQARQAELAEIANAKKQVQEKGVETDHGNVTAYQITYKEGDKEKTTSDFTFDIKAPKEEQQKIKKDAEQARMARYYDEKTGEWIELKDGKTMKEVRAELKEKRAELKAEKKQAKKDLKALNKELKQANAELIELRAKHARGQITQQELEAAQNKVNDLTTRASQLAQTATEAREEYSQVKQAHKASKGKGIGGDTRAYNANVKANNRLYNREVFYDEASAKAAKDNPANKDKTIKVATNEDLMVLQQLAATAERHLGEESSPKERAVWKELANLFKDENGNQISLDKLDTKKVQDALIDITGGDMRLNYTEQKIVAKETGMSMSQVRHAFKTYGFEAPHPIGKRLVNGLVAAAPVAATMGLSYLLSKNKSHAEAHSEQMDVDDAVADATQTTIVNGEVTATTPGGKIDWVASNGEEFHKRFAGQSVTEYYEAVATANAHAEAHAKAFATADAACTAVAALKPAALVGAPLLAFLAGAARTPAEISAVKGAATTQKMATYVDVFKKNKNKNIGNQIVQMAGQITGDKAVDRALIVAVLDHDIGSQNTTPTTRELRSALAHLDAIKAEVDKFKKLPPKEEQQEEQQQQIQQQQQQQQQQPKKEYHADGNNTYKVEKNDILGNIVRAKYPGVNPFKAMEAIKKANGLKDINSLRVGQVLELPEVDGVKPSDAAAKKHIGGKKIKYRPTKTDAQERGTVYEGKEHDGSHDGEKVVDSYTGDGAKARAKKRADELNNQQ